MLTIFYLMKKHMNPFALGDIFADWGIKNGLFTEEKTPKSRNFYVTDKHLEKMEQMKFDVEKLTFYTPVSKKKKMNN